MPSNKRFLAPGFLNRLDQWLLIHKPETWSARTHLVLYYGGGFLLILGLLAFIFPDDPRTDSGVFNWVLFTSVITLIALVVWLIYLLRFNVFKRFGITKPLNRLKAFILYFISIGIILLISFIESGVECIKANRAFGDEEMVNDMNKMNMIITQLEYDSLNHVWGRDTFRIVDTIPAVAYTPPPPSLPPGYEEFTVDTAAVVILDSEEESQGIRLMDTATFNKSIRSGDSTQKLDDSTFIFFTCPTYIFVNNYRLEQFSSAKLYESADVYKAVVKDFKVPDKLKLNTEIEHLIAKYSDPNYRYYTSERRDYTYVMEKKYQIDKVESGLRNISVRKNFWRGSNIEIIVRVFFYITISLSLLVFIFRHSTVKTFFLTLLTACVICLLTALFIALSNSRATGLLFSMIFYFVCFLGISLMAWQTRIRSVAVGIGINLFVAMLTFMPMIIVGFAYAVYDESRDYNQVTEDNRHIWMFIAEIAGPVILLMAIPTIIHKLYRRWYALPEN